MITEADRVLARTEAERALAREFGRRLMRRRISLALSRTELAAAVGKSEAMIQKLERGERLPSTMTIMEICRAIDPRGEHLLGGLERVCNFRERVGIKKARSGRAGRKDPSGR